MALTSDLTSPLTSDLTTYLASPKEIADNYRDLSNWSAFEVTLELIGHDVLITSTEGTNDRGQFAVSGLTIGNNYIVRVKARPGSGTQQKFQTWSFCTITATLIDSNKEYEFTIEATATSGLLRVYSSAGTQSIGDEVYVSGISIVELP